MSKRARRRFDDDDHDFFPDSFARDPMPGPGRDLARDLDPDPYLDRDLDPDRDLDLDLDLDSGEEWSTFNADGVVRGPEPRPPWVITSSAARQVNLGVLKSGKEADVSLIRRSTADQTTLLAVKQYRSAEHRLFHRDSQYLEGRRERRSRERRAMATRTEFGRELIAARWATAEFDILSRLWVAGAAVPYPVQLLGTELAMEFIGSPDGVAAPRLAQTRPDERELVDLFEQLRDVLSHIALAGYAHGDLSAYNVLVDEGRVVVIDLPQAIDIVSNPRGADFVRRDCDNICRWFAARGLAVDAADLAEHLVWLAR